MIPGHVKARLQMAVLATVFAMLCASLPIERSLQPKLVIKRQERLQSESSKFRPKMMSPMRERSSLR